MLSSGLLMIHDTRRGCENDEPKLPRWEQLDNPLLKVGDANVVTRRNYPRFVDSAIV